MDASEAFRKSARDPLNRTPKKLGWELVVRLTPKASHSKIGEIALDTDGQPYLKVYVTAVPEDNKANKALLALLARAFRIPRSKLHIIAGLTDRRKVVWIEGDDLKSMLKNR